MMAPWFVRSSHRSEMIFHWVAPSYDLFSHILSSIPNPRSYSKIVLVTRQTWILRYYILPLKVPLVDNNAKKKKKMDEQGNLVNRKKPLSNEPGSFRGILYEGPWLPHADGPQGDSCLSKNKNRGRQSKMDRLKHWRTQWCSSLFLDCCDHLRYGLTRRMLIRSTTPGDTSIDKVPLVCTLVIGYGPTARGSNLSGW